MNELKWLKLFLKKWILQFKRFALFCNMQFYSLKVLYGAYHLQAQLIFPEKLSLKGQDGKCNYVIKIPFCMCIAHMHEGTGFNCSHHLPPPLQLLGMTQCQNIYLLHFVTIWQVWKVKVLFCRTIQSFLKIFYCIFRIWEAWWLSPETRPRLG